MRLASVPVIHNKDSSQLLSSISGISKQTVITVEVDKVAPGERRENAAATSRKLSAAGVYHRRDDVPPQLPYSLRTRKWSIIIIWSILLLDSCVLPVSLFFILKYAVGWDDVKSKYLLLKSKPHSSSFHENRRLILLQTLVSHPEYSASFLCSSTPCDSTDYCVPQTAIVPSVRRGGL